MATSTTCFRIKNDLKELQALRRRVERLGRRLGLGERLLFEINLVLEELVSNIINYGFDDDGHHWIEVCLQLENDHLAVRLVDDGKPFNPAAAAAPDFEGPVEKRALGNLGIYLAKYFSNDFHYQRVEDKNVLTIRKRLSPAGCHGGEAPKGEGPCR